MERPRFSTTAKRGEIGAAVDKLLARLDEVSDPNRLGRMSPLGLDRMLQTADFHARREDTHLRLERYGAAAPPGAIGALVSDWLEVVVDRETGDATVVLYVALSIGLQSRSQPKTKCYARLDDSAPWRDLRV